MSRPVSRASEKALRPIIDYYKKLAFQFTPIYEGTRGFSTPNIVQSHWCALASARFLRVLRLGFCGLAMGTCNLGFD